MLNIFIRKFGMYFRLKILHDKNIISGKFSEGIYKLKLSQKNESR